MEELLLLLSFVLLASTATVYVARDLAYQRGGWADQVCALYDVCNHLHGLFAATAIVILLYFMVSRDA